MMPPVPGSNSRTTLSQAAVRPLNLETEMLPGLWRSRGAQPPEIQTGISKMDERQQMTQEASEIWTVRGSNAGHHGHVVRRDADADAAAVVPVRQNKNGD